MEIERKRIGDPCPKCGSAIARLRDAFHWRTWSYDGAYCKPCNALWCIDREEIPPLRSPDGPKTLGDRP